MLQREPNGGNEPDRSPDKPDTPNPNTPPEKARRMTAKLVQGSLFTMMVLPAGDPQDPGFDAGIAEQIQRSPGFFVNAPVVLDLKGYLGFLDSAEFDELRALLGRHKLVLIGVQNASAAQQRAAVASGLSCFAGSSAPKKAGERQAQREQAREAAPPPPPPPAPAPPPRSKLVTQPVRSGAQIYARGSDLIVIASVSAGAEIVADGNIHVYGTLRGRAIAGAAGDAEARIFAHRLDAELVSVAGHYLVRENIPSEHIGQSVQVLLHQEKLAIVKTTP